jgi:hypothetical protein
MEHQKIDGIMKRGLHILYAFVCQLIELTLILLLATSLVKRVFFFSYGSYKMDLCSKMGDE